MKTFYELAKKLQFADRLVPIGLRVPLRYKAQKLFGGLEPEMRLLNDLVSIDSTAVDVGGNQGTYTYALAKLCKSVVAFEPIPDCASMIKVWAEGKNVVVHQCALGNQEASLTLHLPRIKGRLLSTRASLLRKSSEGVDINVNVEMLDRFKLENVGFIKIDVEGFELATLQGAVKTIERDKPTLLIEIDPKLQTLEHFSATFGWLEDRGYQGHYLDSEGLRQCDASIQSTHPEFYNFIFIQVVGN